MIGTDEKSDMVVLKNHGPVAKSRRRGRRVKLVVDMMYNQCIWALVSGIYEQCPLLSSEDTNYCLTVRDYVSGEFETSSLHSTGT